MKKVSECLEDNNSKYSNENYFDEDNLDENEDCDDTYLNQKKKIKEKKVFRQTENSVIELKNKK
ncbi:MAG: hypothetical protein R3Y64_09820 [Peptostreptococcaceae bacterium]